MCRVLGSGYYDWLNRSPSDRARRDAALVDIWREAGNSTPTWRLEVGGDGL